MVERYRIQRNKKEFKNNNIHYKDVPIRKAKFKENENIFRCPICRTKVQVCNYKNMVCKNNHCFDIARTGYINLLTKPAKIEYNMDLFRSRNIISSSGFFDPMLEAIIEFILEHIESFNIENAKILDAGCGEGSHLGHIINNLYSKITANIQGIGTDISKDGILMASKGFLDIVWCVGDLANLPFADGQFDVILNILSPSNYEEFGRVLKDNGILVKVVPGSNYLIELRNIFYDKKDKQVYSNEKIVEHYNKNFCILAKKDIHYTTRISKDDLRHLMRMTPLSWNVTDEKIEQVLNRNINDITVDYTIVVGKKGIKL